MPDCTDNRKQRSRVGQLVAVAVAGVALAGFPTAARADGDPASDVLATQRVFLPQDAGVPVAQQGQLAQLLRDTARDGYQIRVALIATRSDLGSVTELWRRPQTYAQFLGQELSFVYRGPLLVVMPDGFGFWSAGSSGASERSVLPGVHVPFGPGGLAAAALSGVQHLAAAAGHNVAILPPHASAPTARSPNPVSIVVFAVGAMLIALAWATSLRARPLASRHRPVAK